MLHDWRRISSILLSKAQVSSCSDNICGVRPPRVSSQTFVYPETALRPRVGFPTDKSLLLDLLTTSPLHYVLFSHPGIEAPLAMSFRASHVIEQLVLQRSRVMLGFKPPFRL